MRSLKTNEKRIRVVVYFDDFERPLEHKRDIPEIIDRALKLQGFMEFWDEDYLEAITSIDPLPLVEASHAYDIMYSDVVDYLGGNSPFYYLYTFRLHDISAQQRARVDNSSLNRYIFYDEFEGEGETLKGLGAHIPGDDYFGVYRVYNPDELWLTGKLKKDHIRAFFNHSRYGDIKAWKEIVESRYPYILQEASLAALEWGADEYDAQMVLLEVLHNLALDSDDEVVLDNLVDTMMTSTVIKDAYWKFQSHPWSTLNNKVYRDIYDKPYVVDTMLETLIEYYTQGDDPDGLDQRIQDLQPSFKMVVYYLIDAFAPLIGEWRLACFASQICKHHPCSAIKEFSSIGEGVQALAANPNLVQIELNLGGTSRSVDLLLRPEDHIPNMSLYKFERYS